MSEKMTLEDKLYLDRFKPDSESHLTVINRDFCVNECDEKPCTFICPARVYEWDEEEEIIKVAYEGCVECGACRYGCPDNINWSNPRGGYGITYKFG